MGRKFHKKDPEKSEQEVSKIQFLIANIVGKTITTE